MRLIIWKNSAELKYSSWEHRASLSFSIVYYWCEHSLHSAFLKITLYSNSQVWKLHPEKPSIKEEIAIVPPAYIPTGRNLPRTFILSRKLGRCVPSSEDFSIEASRPRLPSPNEHLQNVVRNKRFPFETFADPFWVPLYCGKYNWLSFACVGISKPSFDFFHHAPAAD